MIHDRLVCLHQARAAMQVMAATEEAEDEDPTPRGVESTHPVCAPCDPLLSPKYSGRGRWCETVVTSGDNNGRTARVTPAKSASAHA